MSCTTILVGKNASYDGSTMVARNDDCAAGCYTSKKLVLVKPEDQMKVYKSVISHVEIPLPENPLAYSAMVNAEEGEGIWAACGINACNVGMSATETISNNPRVLGADPLVVYQKGDKDHEEVIGGIGEEDLVVLVLPYIRSAKEGVLRLGALLEQYGTYEENGIAFSDANEIWWLETIGGHHWMAKRVDDDAYVMMPNQLGIDRFDFKDAYGKQKSHMCSKDLKQFTEENHLALDLTSTFNPRLAYGTHDDADHVYNTPRAWYMLRYFNPTTYTYDGDQAKYKPEDDNLPWTMVPERKITPDDVKYILSSHFQGTPYDPYGKDPKAGLYRSIGVNRTSFMGLLHIRNDQKEGHKAIEWISEGSNVFNTMVPFYTNVTKFPAYFSDTTGLVNTNNFYWVNRILGALADHSYAQTINLIERYHKQVMSQSYAILNDYDKKLANISDAEALYLKEEANEKISAMVKNETDKVLRKVLDVSCNTMKNAYARSDH